ncbi:DUF953 domain protein [Delphinella strobiligena]|nr:DUF953 domain protein [Delphinella strobiligena]
MPILKPFTVPASAKALELPQDSKAKLSIAFISSADPTTKQPWCPDVRQTLPYINAAFTPSEAPELAIIEGGQRAEWRDPQNPYRRNWNVNNVPTIVRYQRIDGEIEETGRLTEGEILDARKLANLIGKGVGRS